MTGYINVDAVEYHVFERELYATVTLVRTGDISGTASVVFTTKSGTATEGVDFEGTGGTVTFGPQIATVNVSVPILDDQSAEPTESLEFSIVSVDAGSVTIAPITATISILDDENPIADPGPEPLVPVYTVRATPVGSGLVNPISVAFLDGEGGAFVAEKDGVVKYMDLASDNAPVVVLDLRDQVNADHDRGLLGVALHPDLEHFPYFYAYYVVDPPDSAFRTGNAARDGEGNRFIRLSRFTLDLGGTTPAILPNSEVVLVGGGGRSLADIAGGGVLNFTDLEYEGYRPSNIRPDGSFRQDYIKDDSESHAGGGLAFGPDGNLYVSTGDGSSYVYADMRSANAQDPGSLNGKILRIDPITGLGLADNPFADGNLDANRSKVWAVGLRNPYTMTFAPDGRLFIADTGWTAWEEINLGQRGANYGWPFYEGGDNGALLKTNIYENMPAAAAFYDRVAGGSVTVVPAVRAFSHIESDPGPQIDAIVGASSVYTGSRYPADLRHAYFFTDVVDGEIYSVNIDDPQRVQYITDIGAFGPTSLVEGPDGYMYLSDMVNNRILRLEIEAKGPVPAGPSDASGETGAE